LGDTIDVHTGGPDNKFPHHECEIAQSEAVTGQPFVRHWLHCGYLEIDGAKMAKRAGKLYLIPELVEMGYTGADIRMLLLKQHYRSPLPFKLEMLDESKAPRADQPLCADPRIARRAIRDRTLATVAAARAARAS
jgi:cysteinyl-tRNA synthetase